MKLKKTWTRLLSLVMAVAVLSSVSAMAVEPDPELEHAKNSLAKVEITQVYNKKTVEHAEHDYRTDGSQVDITYSAALKMTEEMAIYLQARQQSLADAKFNVHVHMDMKNLEFKGTSDTVKVVFESTFLKPDEKLAKENGISARLLSVKDGVYSYELTMSKAAVKSDMVIPMELIVYAGADEVLGYQDAVEKHPEATLMYKDFEVADWMAPITLKFANMEVKDSVADTITTDSKTWKTVKASGTVDGTFTYVKMYEPDGTIGSTAAHIGQGFVENMQFGDGKDDDVTAWTSNVVTVDLLRTTKPSGGGSGPSNLNTKDHYSYIIGYKDGLLRPYGTITRGEVATIFFRLLTDEAREKYWCQTNDYTDVPMELWCNNAISTLSNMGIIDGFNDGSFRPYGKITRAQFSKMAVGFFETNKADFQPYFTDVVEDAWYAEYVTAAVNAGIIQGFQDGTFRPNTSITRAQTCVIVNRVLNRAPEEDHLLPEREMLVWPDNTPDMWFYADMQEATNSHDYKWVATGEKDENGKSIKIEKWTEKLGQRDWAALEHAWSDAHSAHGGGEVVKP